LRLAAKLAKEWLSARRRVDNGVVKAAAEARLALSTTDPKIEM